MATEGGNIKTKSIPSLPCKYFRDYQNTKEEFNTAQQQFKNSGKPLIYTFFKDAHIKTGSADKQGLKSLWAFQKKLSDLGHFHTTYNDIEHLKRQFKDQLENLFDKGW